MYCIVFKEEEVTCDKNNKKIIKGEMASRFFGSWILINISAYRQDKKSRLSCDLNELLTRGLTMKRVCNQKEDLANQIKDMEAMLKHQKNEIEDLEVR